MSHAITAAEHNEGSTCALRMTISTYFTNPWIFWIFLPVQVPAYHAAVVPVAWIHPWACHAVFVTSKWLNRLVKCAHNLYPHHFSQLIENEQLKEWNTYMRHISTVAVHIHFCCTVLHTYFFKQTVWVHLVLCCATLNFKTPQLKQLLFFTLISFKKGFITHKVKYLKPFFLSIAG